jgi:hypothetical protein
VLAKAQQIVMNFWVLDDAKLLNILLDGMGLGAHERIDDVSDRIFLKPLPTRTAYQ